MTDIRFPRASNRADWRFRLKNTDPTDGTLVDLSPYSITIQVKRRDRCGPALSVSTPDSRITFPSPGVIDVVFPASQMSGLCADTYDIGAVVSDGAETAQLILGTVPVVDGVVR